MRGSVVRPAGRRRTWSFRIDVGRDPETGRRRQRWVGGFKTRKEAQAALARMITTSVREPTSSRRSRRSATTWRSGSKRSRGRSGPRRSTVIG